MKAIKKRHWQIRVKARKCMIISINIFHKYVICTDILHIVALTFAAARTQSFVEFIGFIKSPAHLPQN